MHRFRYTRPFHRMDPEPFLRDFFNSDVVREHFEVVDAKGQWRALTDAAGASAGARCVGVRHGRSCRARSLHGPLRSHPRASGPANRPRGTDALLKRVDDVIEGFTVADELRDFILNESSENAHLVGEDARAEFLFRLFSHCALGGSMCQFEDSITPYLDVTKRLYKALVNAKKDPNADVGSTGARGRGVGRVCRLRRHLRGRRGWGRGWGREWGCFPGRETDRTSVTSASIRGRDTSRCGTMGSGRTGERGVLARARFAKPSARQSRDETRLRDESLECRRLRLDDFHLTDVQANLCGNLVGGGERLDPGHTRARCTDARALPRRGRAR